MWETAFSDYLDKENPNVAKFIDKTIPMMTDLALKQLKINRNNVKELEIRPQKLTIVEPGTKLVIPPVKENSGNQ